MSWEGPAGRGSHPFADRRPRAAGPPRAAVRGSFWSTADLKLRRKPRIGVPAPDRKDEAIRVAIARQTVEDAGAPRPLNGTFVIPVVFFALDRWATARRAEARSILAPPAWPRLRVFRWPVQTKKLADGAETASR